MVICQSCFEEEVEVGSFCNPCELAMRKDEIDIEELIKEFECESK